MISVVIPVYNAAKYLRECLDSARVAAEKVEAEVICVDDGSTDGSSEILDEFQKEAEGKGGISPDRRESRSERYAGCGQWKILHQKNAGAWAARNAALEVAQGEWITFVDADDVLDRHWLGIGLSIAEKTQADLVRLGSHYGREVPAGFAERPVDEEFTVLNGVAAAAWMWDVMAAGGFLWRCFIRREVIGDLKLPQLNVKEDSIWLLGLAQRVKRVAEGRFAGYFYRATEGSLMKQNRKVSQCVGYLEAMGALWTQQSEQAARDGYLDVIRRNIRMSADNDVIEWVMKRAKHDDLPEERIREAYAELESAGVFKGTSYVNRRRYWLGFLWWKRTGQVWAMKIPGLLFLWARMVIDRLKS